MHNPNIFYLTTIQLTNIIQLICALHQACAFSLKSTKTSYHLTYYSPHQYTYLFIINFHTNKYTAFDLTFQSTKHKPITTNYSKITQLISNPEQ